ncbi:MAG: glycosyltransferase family 39 protein [Candidatus Moraniibacteriota bacterium]
MPYFLSFKNLPLAAVLASIILFYAFGLFHLGKFETVDEHFWKYERIPQYWNALADGKWKKTYINDKPGVSVALVSGIGLFFADPESHRLRDTETTLDGKLTVYDAGKTERINIALRLPILAISGLLVLYIFFAIRRASDDPLLAALTAIIIALSPILLGISQIVNPDALLWSLGAGAFFSYFAFLKTEEKRFLAATAVLTGCALLSKYTANILYPLLFALLLSNFFFSHGRILARGDVAAYLRRHLLCFLAVILGSFAVFAALLPAVFVKPSLFWQGTLGFWQSTHIFAPLLVILIAIGLDACVNRARLIEVSVRAFGRYALAFLRFSLVLPLFFFGTVFVLGLGDQALIPLDRLIQTAKDDGTLAFPLLANAAPLSAFLQKLLAEAYPFVFSLPPVILLSVFFLWIRLIMRGRQLSDALFLATLLSWFAIAYFTASLSAGVLANARYSIILYPLFAFLAALGIREMITLVPESRRSVVSRLILPFIVVSLALGLFHSKPFFFNYVSPLLKKDFAVHDAWGYGLYEAAQYLNALPEARDAFVWSDRNGICQFLSGPRCISGYRIDTARTPPGYFIISKRGIERGYVPRDKGTGAIPIDYAAIENDALWRLDIGGRPDNFILIVPHPATQ